MKNSRVQFLAVACTAVLFLEITPVYSSASTTNLPAEININHLPVVQIAQAGISVDVPGTSINVGGDGRIRVNTGETGGTHVDVGEGVQVNTGNSRRRTTTHSINNDGVSVTDETGSNVRVGEGSINISTGDGTRIGVNSESGISVKVEESGSTITGNGCGASGGESYANQNLSNTRFSNKNLNNANFSNSVLESITFENTPLRASNFSNASISRSQLSAINLQRACLNNSNFEQVVFTGSDLHQAAMNNANFEEVQFRSANLSSASLNNSNFSNCDLSGANLRNATIRNTNFNQVKLDGATWIDGRVCREGSIDNCR